MDVTKASEPPEYVSVELPKEFRQAHEQNMAKFDDITLNIKQLFDGMDKPFLKVPQKDKKKKTKPQRFNLTKAQQE